MPVIRDSNGAPLALFATDGALNYGDYAGAGSVGEANIRVISEETVQDTADDDYRDINIMEVGEREWRRVADPHYGRIRKEDDEQMQEMADCDVIIVVMSHNYHEAFIRVSEGSNFDPRGKAEIDADKRFEPPVAGTYTGEEWLRRLENYPLLDDQAHSDIEERNFEEAFANFDWRDLDHEGSRGAGWPTWLRVAVQSVMTVAEGQSHFEVLSRHAGLTHVVDLFQEIARDNAADDNTFIPADHVGKNVLKRMSAFDWRSLNMDVCLMLITNISTLTKYVAFIRTLHVSFKIPKDVQVALACVVSDVAHIAEVPDIVGKDLPRDAGEVEAWPVDERKGIPSVSSETIDAADVARVVTSADPDGDGWASEDFLNSFLAWLRNEDGPRFIKLIKSIGELFQPVAPFTGDVLVSYEGPQPLRNPRRRRARARSRR